MHFNVNIFLEALKGRLRTLKRQKNKIFITLMLLYLFIVRLLIESTCIKDRLLIEELRHLIFKTFNFFMLLCNIFIF